MEERKKLLLKYVYIFLVVAAYWIISISMVFINKVLFSSKAVHLNAPLFITWFQCIVCVTICILLKRSAILFPKYIIFTKIKFSFTKETTKKILPLSLLFTGMIVSNNLCLKHVGVAFYYIGRSLTTVFNVIFTYITLREKTSYSIIVCCIVIVSGFWIGVDQEHIAGSLSIPGTIFGILGSLTLSLYSINTKKVLSFVDQDIWQLSYYNNAYSIILFLPLMILNGDLVTVYNYDRLCDPYFWFVMTLGGVCGFAIGFVTMLQIKVTSPLTHNVSGTAKSCVQTVLATYWYNENKPILWWISNVLVLGGSMAYARIKQRKMEKNVNISSSSN